MKTMIFSVVLGCAASLFAQSQISQTSMLEANRETTQYGTTELPSFLPMVPLAAPSSEPPSVFQSTLTPSFTIQAVPEPSAMMLGGVSLGILASVRFFRNRI